MRELPRDYSVWTTETDVTLYLPGTIPPDVRFAGPMTAPDAYRLRRQAAALFPAGPWTLRAESDSRTVIPLSEFHDCDTDHPLPADSSFPPAAPCRFYGMRKGDAEQVTVSFTVTDTITADGLLRIIGADPGLVPGTTTAKDATGLRILRTRTCLL